MKMRSLAPLSLSLFLTKFHKNQVGLIGASTKQAKDSTFKSHKVCFLVKQTNLESGDDFSMYGCKDNNEMIAYIPKKPELGEDLTNNTRLVKSVLHFP